MRHRYNPKCKTVTLHNLLLIGVTVRCICLIYNNLINENRLSSEELPSANINFNKVPYLLNVYSIYLWNGIEDV